MATESFILEEQLDLNRSCSIKCGNKKFSIKYLIIMIVTALIFYLVMKFSVSSATSPAYINNRNRTDFESSHDAENDCISQRHMYTEMITQHKKHVDTCGNEIQEMLIQIMSDQRTRAQLHYLNQKCEIQRSKLNSQNTTVNEEYDTGSHLSCEEDVSDYEFRRYLLWMDNTVCQFKKEEIQNQQNRIQQEKNSLESDYQTCNAQFQYRRVQNTE